jgi:hypothetical protein
MDHSRSLMDSLAAPASLLRALWRRREREISSSLDVASPFPPVWGSWLGDWTCEGLSTPACLSLTQRNDRVEGTLVVGSQVNDIVGTISALGVLRFEGRPRGRAPNFASASPHLALADASTELDGPVARGFVFGGRCDMMPAPGRLGKSRSAVSPRRRGWRRRGSGWCRERPPRGRRS